MQELGTWQDLIRKVNPEVRDHTYTINVKAFLVGRELYVGNETCTWSYVSKVIDHIDILNTKAFLVSRVLYVCYIPSNEKLRCE